MSSRIRYNKTNKEGVVVSNKVFKSSNGATYQVWIDENDVTYSIKNLTSRRLYKGGENINNLTHLKTAIKNHLGKLGVSFESEIRDNSNRVPGVNCALKRNKES